MKIVCVEQIQPYTETKTYLSYLLHIVVMSSLSASDGLVFTYYARSEELTAHSHLSKQGKTNVLEGSTSVPLAQKFVP